MVGGPEGRLEDVAVRGAGRVPAEVEPLQPESVGRAENGAHIEPTPQVVQYEAKGQLPGGRKGLRGQPPQRVHGSGAVPLSHQ